jgi:hypothetical protein
MKNGGARFSPKRPATPDHPLEPDLVARRYLLAIPRSADLARFPLPPAARST